ncbi:uncharacterized protein HGUI_01858 [Hanseniaspora guilliermondii]|uniref:Trafficking protein particle complex subunit 2 n=1 Tax=Hanseniaspora guilliermondii TaxID=56406 RepID=A0A1L0AZU2_9ASCO|nr:uncharacterized protein HGUI_01858 [Hanseniaspora guilliermondii]
MSIPLYFAILHNKTDSALYETFLASKDSLSAEDIPLKDLYPFIANSAIDVIDNIQQANQTNLPYNKTHLHQKVQDLVEANMNSKVEPNKTSFFVENILVKDGSNKSLVQKVTNTHNNPQNINSLPEGSLFLGTIDEYDGYLVSSYVTYNNTKFMVISDKNHVMNYLQLQKFFLNVHDLYLKHLMNPFTSAKGDMPIKSLLFDAKIKVFGDLYLLS